jgi:hypothetical protein
MVMPGRYADGSSCFEPGVNDPVPPLVISVSGVQPLHHDHLVQCSPADYRIYHIHLTIMSNYLVV